MDERAITAQGSDIEEAIQKGLTRLGLSRTDVIIDVVDEGRKGLLGLGGRDAVVRLTPLPRVADGDADADEDEEEEVTLPSVAAQALPEPEAETLPEATHPAQAAQPAGVEAEPAVDAPAEEAVVTPPEEAAAASAPPQEVAQPPAETPSPLPAAEAPAADAEAEEDVGRDEVDEDAVDEEVVATVQEIVADLMDKMGFSGVEVGVSYTEPDDKTGRVMTIVEIEDGDELNSLIGPHGETLNDFQYLVRLMAGHVVKRRANFLLDVNGYRKRRREALAKLAERMADKAVRRGEPVTLEAMNAYDRRLVHIALRDHDEVYTNSVGEGSNRRVRIYLHQE